MDHQPLTFLQSLKEPKGRLACWVNELSQYDFKVHYKSGVEQTDADALSRRPHSCEDTKQLASLCHPDIAVCQNISIDPSYTNAELANLKRLDPVLRRVIDKLVTSNVCPPSSGPWCSGALRRYRQIWSQLMIQDGVLCRFFSPGPRQRPTTTKILPSSVAHDVLQQLHNDSFGGHLGIGKTADWVRERFYWHNYSKELLNI